jgi:hypothetical protein
VRINNPAKSTLFSTEELREIEGTSDTVTLPDGRTLGYAQYGLRTGKVVFYNHGLPGSRIEAAAYDAIATRLGARIIAVDRPGYGLSSPQPSRTILGFAKDIERLAESLNIDNYGVLVLTSLLPHLAWTLLLTSGMTGDLRWRPICFSLRSRVTCKQIESCLRGLWNRPTGHE